MKPVSYITKTLIALACFGLLQSQKIFSQNTSVKKQKMAVLNIETNGLGLDPSQMGNLLRLEMERLDTFEVVDKYDVAYLIEKHKLTINNCYGKECLVEVGTTINVDKMLSGGVNLYGDMIIVTLRQIDIRSKVVEKSYVKEFLNLPKEIQTILNVSLHEFYDKGVNKDIMMRLTKEFNYDNLTNNPEAEKLSLDGPRMGFTVFTGKTADYLRGPKQYGGYDAFPLMFQFGYQFEKQYLNEGNFQALFEFVPMVTGLDQGLFIPSFTIMNGLRNNKNGWEFAFGPSATLITTAEGYYENNTWHRKQEWNETNTDSFGSVSPNPNPITTRMDSRGDVKLSTSFIFAFGKTFKSGKLNIPVNAYVVPHKDGVRVGASFGFNAKKS